MHSDKGEERWNLKPKRAMHLQYERSSDRPAVNLIPKMNGIIL